ncbi:protein translocase SEC61 complex subunit gamma [Candidatus Woesearchaeota archaeon]|nr:protein translocase SEC61 complex subunit gamma [Candidatus Woesearchaeota archaeon]
MEEQQETQEQETVEEEEVQTQQPSQPGRLQRFKSFLGECKRVLKITKKPTIMEFKTIVKVSGLGMLLIGLIGFLITMANQLLLR